MNDNTNTQSEIVDIDGQTFAADEIDGDESESEAESEQETTEEKQRMCGDKVLRSKKRTNYSDKHVCNPKFLAFFRKHFDDCTYFRPMHHRRMRSQSEKREKSRRSLRKPRLSPRNRRKRPLRSPTLDCPTLSAPIPSRTAPTLWTRLSLSHSLGQILARAKGVTLAIRPRTTRARTGTTPQRTMTRQSWNWTQTWTMTMTPSRPRTRTIPTAKTALTKRKCE